MTAGDTMFAVSLAGSLFFSISPTEAKDKVLLYLLLTVGPFAVAAPALGPIIDRSRGARRAMVVASALGRAALCPFLARDIHSLLLFPEAFAMLVLSKVYVVTKGALVPEMAAIGMLDAVAARAGGATTPSHPDRSGCGPRRPPTRPHPPLRHAVVHLDDPDTGDDRVEPDLATLNARLGLLASLSGFVFALPAVAISSWEAPPVCSGCWSASSLRPPSQEHACRCRVPGDGTPARVARVGAAPAVVVAPGVEGGLDRGSEDEADLAAFRPIATPRSCSPSCRCRC